MSNHAHKTSLQSPFPDREGISEGNVDVWVYDDKDVRVYRLDLNDGNHRASAHTTLECLQQVHANLGAFLAKERKDTAPAAALPAYIIVEEHSPEYLASMVSAKVARGYMPVGGPTCRPSAGTRLESWFQALVLRQWP